MRNVASRVVSALALCCGLLALWGCNEESPEVEEKFVAAFVDMRVMETIYRAESATTRLARRDILKKYGYTRETYLARIEQIMANEMYWVPFQKQVVAKIDSTLDPVEFMRRKAIEAAKAKSKKKKEDK